MLIPWLVGDRIGMHPVAVIFSIMAGGQLFGFLGVLLVGNVDVVIRPAVFRRFAQIHPLVTLGYAHEQYKGSAMYGRPRQAAGTDGAMVATPVVLEPAPEAGVDAAPGPVVRPDV